MSDLDLDPIVARADKAKRALAKWRDGEDSERGISMFAQSADDVPAMVDEVRKLRAIVERVRAVADGTEHPGVSLIDPRPLAEALVDQCHHIDGGAECWHFGDRDGRDG